MQQIAEWLDGLGMSEYAWRFAENDIDFAILSELTDQDLEKIGVASLGHRRKLLRAIANLEAAKRSVPAGAVAVPVAPFQQETAERRQVTVMFCDLVGSTALSARMDPEDLRDVISAYQKCVAGTVRRFNGFVAKYLGDGVLVYFGYPEAHEDDVERAVHAGLDIVAAVSALKARVPLQTRVGIATGVVVVGDLVGSGEAQERGIVGETPNLASRLQSIAESNTVVIAEDTRKLLGNLFEFGELGARDFKGIAEPLQTWTVLRASSVASRFEALHSGKLTALVGREEETELLLRRWARAKNGEGQVVFLSGEPGIGKSRLTAAVMETLAGEPHTRLRYFCSPQHTDSALYPIIGQMERAAELTNDDTIEIKLDKIDELLAQTSTSRKDAALLAEMLSLPNDGRYPTLALDARQKRQRTLEALEAQLEALARSSPVLMAFEDVHWIDPTSLEVLGRVVSRAARSRVLLVVTFRPEFSPPWIGRSHVTALTLNRLGDRDVGAMVDRIVGNKLIAANIRNDIIERTDGIPLFVEEMTKAVLEAESEDAAKHLAAAVPAVAPAVPASLHASLMARLDRLGPAKEMAQTGAAIGREFSHALVAAVARKPEIELNAALNRLTDAGLLFCQGVPPHASYQFKHALVRDAAYGTLLRNRRQQLHAIIAAAVVERSPSIAQTQPEILAHHYTEAGMADEAIRYWVRAGQFAGATSAYIEAIAHLRRGLGLVNASRGAHTQEQELELLLALGPCLVATQGYSSDEVGKVYERTNELCEVLHNGEHLFASLNGQFLHRSVTGKTREARRLAERMKSLADRQLDLSKRVLSSRAIAVPLMQMGELLAAREALEEVIILYDPQRDLSLAMHGTHDPRATGAGFLTLILWMLGYPDQAKVMQTRALAYAAERNHAHTTAHVRNFAGLLDLFLDDVSAVDAHADALVGLAKQHELGLWLGHGSVIQSWGCARRGRLDAGIALLREGIANLTSRRATFHVPYYCGLLAEMLGKAGNMEEAMDVISGAHELAGRTEQYFWEPELRRLEGELRCASGLGDDDVETCFVAALDLARRQSAKSLELRAATCLARLWRDQGKRTEARDLLGPIYGWFTEGFDTPDLKEAKALLDLLAS